MAKKISYKKVIFLCKAAPILLTQRRPRKPEDKDILENKTKIH